MNIKYSGIEEVLAALREGKPVIISDAEDRENEGDAIIAAQFATPEWVAWMVRYTSGYLCAPMSEERANQLELPLMWLNSEDPHQTAYTVSVDAANRKSTGISAAERANTANVLANPHSTPASLIRPGHVIPLRAVPGGVKERAGHTEAAVELLEMAGLEPVALMAELVNDDGTMMRGGELFEVAKRFDLPMSTISHLRDHLEKRSPERKSSTNRIRFEAEAKLPTTHGDFKVRGYYDVQTTADHVAIIAGDIGSEDVLVRLHSECITGEAFGSLKCECGPQLEGAMDAIGLEKTGGVVVYLRGQEGRGIGLLNKIKAYALQDSGADTVEANVQLGFEPDSRQYDICKPILAHFHVQKLRLMTNNPRKVDALQAMGIEVTEIVPMHTQANPHNESYLAAKFDKLGHLK